MAQKFQLQADCSAGKWSIFEIDQKISKLSNKVTSDAKQKPAFFLKTNEQRRLSGCKTRGAPCVFPWGGGIIEIFFQLRTHERKRGKRAQCDLWFRLTEILYIYPIIIIIIIIILEF